MEPVGEWHVEIYRPGSAVPDIAQTTLPTWRTLRTYIAAAKRIWPDAIFGWSCRNLRRRPCLQSFGQWASGSPERGTRRKNAPQVT